MTDFTLSTLDREAPRSYIRYALTFACDAAQAAAAVEKLQKATKRLVSEIPMLAGVVATSVQANPIITVTLQQVNDFEATIADLKNEHQNYAAVRRQGIAPRYIFDITSTSLASDLIGDTNPCCIIQANLVGGGLILVINLHHAVADICGVATILRLMSEGLPARELSEESLNLEAVAISQARARLSSGFGAPAFLATARDVEQRRQLSRQQYGTPSDSNTPTESASDSSPDASSNRAVVLRFKLSIIVQIANMIKTRRSLRNTNPADKITLREVLIAILWQAYVRARWSSGTRHTARSSVSFPVDIRPHIVPELEPHWMGNAEVTTIATEDTTRLYMPYDLTPIERTATIIHGSANSVSSDLITRSRIELINESASTPDRPETQLVVHDWTPVPVMLEHEMDPGLGLGRPDAIRRTGRTLGANEVVLLPEDHQAQAWDVQVELQRDWMSAMLMDEQLRRFVWSVVR
jgi:hypothetical protein